MNPSWCLSPDRHSCRAVFRIQFFLRPPGSGRFRGGCPAASDLEGGPLPPPETETKRLRRGGRTAGGSRRPEEIQAWWARNQWEFVKLKQSFVLLTVWQSLFRASRGVYFFISGRPGPHRSGMFSVYEVRFKEELTKWANLSPKYLTACGAFPIQTVLRAGDDAVRSHFLSSVSGEMSRPQPKVSTLQGGAERGTGLSPHRGRTPLPGWTFILLFLISISLQYLVQRQYCKTVLMENLISKYLPSAFIERQKIHLEEMAELSK